MDQEQLLEEVRRLNVHGILDWLHWYNKQFPCISGGWRTLPTDLVTEMARAMLLLENVQRELRRRGGQVRREKARRDAEWMRPIFAEACANLSAKGRKFDRRRLFKEAYRIARDHPRRGDLNEN